MDKNITWAWVIKNTAAIFVWVTLAIVFDKWWIALFALLFICGIKYHGPNTYRICDKCGKHSPYAKNPNEALDMAKAAGWIHIAEGNEDYCPDCQKNVH